MKAEDNLNWIKSLYQRVEQPVSRRAWLRAAGLGFGSLGLTAMLGEEAALIASSYQQSDNPLYPKPSHFEPKAKRVIFLFMHGGPSSIDTFDPKERLVRDHGKPLPIKRPLAFADGKVGPLMKPLWDFKPGGKSGIPVSEGVDHGAAMLQTFTGSSTFVRPSMGSWTIYGLGTENQNLPGFITIKPTLSH